MRTRIEPAFDAAAVRELKARSERDITIGGAAPAAQSMRDGLVDECQLLLSPVIVGGGKPALPRDSLVRLELLAQRRFEGGVVCLCHAMLT